MWPCTIAFCRVSSKMCRMCRAAFQPIRHNDYPLSATIGGTRVLGGACQSCWIASLLVRLRYPRDGQALSEDGVCCFTDSLLLVTLGR